MLVDTARDQGTTVLRFVHSGILGDGWGDEFLDQTSQGWDMSKTYFSDGNTADYSKDFEPGTLTDPLTLPAGSYDLAITAPDAADAVAQILRQFLAT